jgi:hypothetical protein
MGNFKTASAGRIKDAGCREQGTNLAFTLPPASAIPHPYAGALLVIEF